MKKAFSILFFLFSMNTLLNAQTNVVLPAAKDNTIYSDNTANSNGAGPNFTTGATFTASVRRALIKFDLSAIPSGATITAASLTLTLNKTVSGPLNVSLHRLTADWGEGASDAGAGPDGMGVPAMAGDATWICSFADGVGGCTTSWTTNGSDYDPSVSATTAVDGNGAYIWSSGQMITDVQSWLNNPPNNFGWVIIGDEATAGSAKRFASRTNANVPDQPFLSVTYSTVLPVNLVYFKAQAQKFGSRLSWQTAQETNSDFFEIEFSTDGISFSIIDKVKAAGHSSTALTYNYDHMTSERGKLFYRLVQVDINGRKTISKIETVVLKDNTASLVIAPNPVINKIVVHGPVIDNKLRYQIYNLQAVKMAEGALLNNEIILPVNLTSGIYFLRIIQSDGSVRSVRFIKH